MYYWYFYMHYFFIFTTITCTFLFLLPTTWMEVLIRSESCKEIPQSGIRQILFLSQLAKNAPWKRYAKRCSMLFLMHKHTLVIKTNRKSLLLSYIHLFLLRPWGHKHTCPRQKAQQRPMLYFLSWIKPCNQRCQPTQLQIQYKGT